MQGLSLFSGTLCIYGIRSHYKRDESAQFQPFDLIHHHEEHLRVWPSPNYASVFFGGYEDGSGICAENESANVYRVVPGEVKPANEWPDIKTLLESEHERISKLFTEDGYLRQKGLATTPERKNRKWDCRVFGLWHHSPVSTVAEIKAAIPKLTLEERAEVARALHAWADDDWDEQMKHDLAAGKLNKLLTKVDTDIANGNLSDLP